MTSRREFLQAGVTSGALIALSALPKILQAAACPQDAPSESRFYKAIYDTRFTASVAFARDMRQRGVTTHAINGDVTAVWYHDLHFAWATPIRIVGLTTSSALFCLEILARDAGHRVTRRETVDDDLVAWEIAPKERPFV